MADNDLTIHTAGADRALAGKDASGVYHESALNETLNAAGNPAYTSTTNPMPVTVDVGTLMQRIEMLEMLLGRQLSGAGSQIPDTAGRTRVTIDAHPAAVASVARLTAFGAGAPNADLMQINLTNLPALELRNQIKVS